MGYIERYIVVREIQKERSEGRNNTKLIVTCNVIAANDVSHEPVTLFNLFKMDDQLELPTSVVPKDQQDEDEESSDGEGMPDWENIPLVQNSYGLTFH